MKHVIIGNKDDHTGIKSRVDGLPITGRIMLCILVTLAQNNVLSTKLRRLKSIVLDCMRQTHLEDEYIGDEDFANLIGTLTDSGLLLAKQNPLSKGNLGEQEIQLGQQMEDVRKVLEKELNEPFYVKMRENASAYQNNV